MAKRKAWIFDGGGFPGVKQVGWAEEADARGEVPDLIQGISVGALNAAKFVESGAAALKEYWLEVEERGPSSVFDFNKWSIAKRIYQKKPSLLSSESLDDLVGDLDMKKVMSSPIELQIVVRNETQNCSQIFSSRNGYMIDNPEVFRQVIKASAALPGVFPPVMINGERFSDGCHFELDDLEDFELIVILVNDDPGLTGLVAGGKLWERISLIQRELMDDHTKIAIDKFLLKNRHFNSLSVNSGLKGFKKVAEKWKNFFAELFVKDERPADQPKHRLVLISPSYEIPSLRLHTFNPGDITRAIQESRKQAKEVLDELYPPTTLV